MHLFYFRFCTIAVKLPKTAFVLFYFVLLQLCRQLKMCKAPVKLSPQTNDHLLQTRCPSCRPANNVRALKGKIARTSSPKITWRSSNLVFDHDKAPGYLVGEVPSPSAVLWRQYLSGFDSSGIQTSHWWCQEEHLAKIAAVHQKSSTLHMGISET